MVLGDGKNLKSDNYLKIFIPECYLHVKVIMTRKVCMQDEFLNSVHIRVKQDILEQKTQNDTYKTYNLLMYSKIIFRGFISTPHPPGLFIDPGSSREIS